MNSTSFIKAIRQLPGWLSPKTLLVMKLTCALLIIGFLQVSAKGLAQKITLNEKNVPLEKVLNKIKKQSGYVFLFTDQELKKTTITVSVKDASVPEALNACLKNVAITYKIVENNILLRAADSEPLNIKVSPTPVNISVKGKIIDENGSPLAGATIMVKGSGRATVSNENGDFTIDNIANDATLVISFVGYTSREISVKQSLDRIRLSPAKSDLNEIVVVGYGTEKKINVTGSVASASGTTLTERPAANLQNLLEGRIPGLTVVQPTGEPGIDQGSIQVRGLGSYGADPSPLILIDGIAGSLNNLSPQDIESVTVLKDAASSSIYGSRAANGVILVTTKSGKRGTNILVYDNSFGTTTATRLPSLITNSATYMMMFNEAQKRNGQPDVYTQAQIDAYKAGNGSAQYPNTDWFKFYFHSAPIQRHNLTLSGGDSVSTYYVSAGYLNQKGISAGYDYQRYNSQINYTRKVNRKIAFGTNMNLSYENSLTPFFTGWNAMINVLAQAPTFSKYLPDGSGRVVKQDFTNNGFPNIPLYIRDDQGRTITKKYNINAQGYLNINIIKGLDWKTTGAFVFYNEDYNFHQYSAPYPVYAFQPNASGNYVELNNSIKNYVNQSSGRALVLTVNSTLNYQKDFGADHHFVALAGYEQINNTSTDLGGNRYNYTNSVLHVLNAGPTTGMNNNGDESQFALQSLFGRLTYNFKEKYLLEADMRYDGTSRVGPDNRWGTFGGGAAAWRVSEEDLIKKNLNWVDNLKIRASYGVLGNQQIGNYPYQATLTNSQYPFGGALSPGVNSTALVDPNLRWEKTATTDIGVDFSILADLFGGSVDWYYKNTTGILAAESDVPESLGLSAPVINAGAMVNKGWEFQLTHQNHIGDFSYGANVILSFNRNKVTQALNPDPGVFQVGLPFNSFYLYKWDGIFNSQAEIDASPKQPNSGNLKPGDLKIKDVNGNGVIDPDDRVSISPYPSYTYSFGVNAGYKGFKLTTFFQGVQGLKVYGNAWGIDPFFQGGPPNSTFLNAWTPQNHSQTVPAVYEWGYPGVAGYRSTYYIHNASYLRLKNVNLSYSFPKNTLKSIGLKGLTVFVSGDNLITWTKFLGEDPESTSVAGFYTSYPQIKTYSAGLKVSL